MTKGPGEATRIATAGRVHRPRVVERLRQPRRDGDAKCAGQDNDNLSARVQRAGADGLGDGFLVVHCERCKVKRSIIARGERLEIVSIYMPPQGSKYCDSSHVAGSEMLDNCIVGGDWSCRGAQKFMRSLAKERAPQANTANDNEKVWRNQMAQRDQESCASRPAQHSITNARNIIGHEIKLGQQHEGENRRLPCSGGPPLEGGHQGSGIVGADHDSMTIRWKWEATIVLGRRA